MELQQSTLQGPFSQAQDFTFLPRIHKASTEPKAYLHTSLTQWALKVLHCSVDRCLSCCSNRWYSIQILFTVCFMFEYASYCILSGEVELHVYHVEPQNTTTCLNRIHLHSFTTWPFSQHTTQHNFIPSIFTPDTIFLYKSTFLLHFVLCR